MESLKQKINADFIIAFKAKDLAKKMTLSMIKAAILEKEKREGNDGSELNDEETLEIIKSYDKKLSQTIDAYSSKNSDNAIKAIEEAKIEKEIISIYLPTKMSKEEISDKIIELTKSIDLSNKNIAIGAIMKHFKQNYDGLYDAKFVKQYIDSIIGK